MNNRHFLSVLSGGIASLAVAGAFWFGLGFSGYQAGTARPVFAAGILPATAWWEKKPYMEWSIQEAHELLSDSPWVAFSLAGTRATPYGVRPTIAPPGTVGNPSAPVRKDRLDYCIRLLTARTVREAMLRLISLGAFAELVVKTEDLKIRSAADQERARLEGFISTRPGDLRLKGDPQHIIIGITVRVTTSVSGRFQAPPLLTEDAHPEEIMPLTLAELAPETCLLTTGGGWAQLARYEPPGSDHLGAKFYFARTMSDGRPLIKPGDRELRFETRLRGKMIRIRFDLKKMIYGGRLEV